MAGGSVIVEKKQFGADIMDSKQMLGKIPSLEETKKTFYDSVKFSMKMFEEYMLDKREFKEIVDTNSIMFSHFIDFQTYFRDEIKKLLEEILSFLKSVAVLSDLGNREGYRNYYVIKEKILENHKDDPNFEKKLRESLPTITISNFIYFKGNTDTIKQIYADPYLNKEEKNLLAGTLKEFATKYENEIRGHERLVADFFKSATPSLVQHIVTLKVISLSKEEKERLAKLQSDWFDRENRKIEKELKEAKRKADEIVLAELEARSKALEEIAKSGRYDYLPIILKDYLT